MFNAERISELIQKWLAYSVPTSLFFTGVPGTGKTTMLQIIWQIMRLNDISVYYFNALEFEQLCINLFNKSITSNVGDKIEAMVSNAKRSDVLLLDDHVCFELGSALMYYLRIFNARSEANKPVIITSNKTFNEVLETYNAKGTTESQLIMERIYSRLVDRLKISEIVFRK